VAAGVEGAIRPYERARTDDDGERVDPGAVAVYVDLGAESAAGSVSGCESCHSL
jgi:hypothetical protein